mmetsp:Transcript_78727/g.182635  ORF Transcript_78727/g.182635 Transcript_78727/m.182635 type:complete len:248 (+) Transcript_78727:283-1026(+)
MLSSAGSERTSSCQNWRTSCSWPSTLWFNFNSFETSARAATLRSSAVASFLLPGPESVARKRQRARGSSAFSGQNHISANASKSYRIMMLGHMTVQSCPAKQQTMQTSKPMCHLGNAAVQHAGRLGICLSKLSRPKKVSASITMACVLKMTHGRSWPKTERIFKSEMCSQTSACIQNASRNEPNMPKIIQGQNLTSLSISCRAKSTKRLNRTEHTEELHLTKTPADAKTWEYSGNKSGLHSQTITLV